MAEKCGNKACGRKYEAGKGGTSERCPRCYMHTRRHPGTEWEPKGEPMEQLSVKLPRAFVERFAQLQVPLNQSLSEFVRDAAMAALKRAEARIEG